MKLFLIIVTIAFAFLTAQAQERERKIRRDQLPPAVEKTVAKESEGATIKGLSTEVEQGQRFYEVTLDINGHNRDVLIDKNGNVVEVEDEVTLESLPAPVQDALKKAAGNGTIGIIESLTKNGAIVAYEAHIKHGRKWFEIQFGPNGERLKRLE